MRGPSGRHRTVVPSLLCTGIAAVLLAFGGCDRDPIAVAARPTVPPGPCAVTGVVRYSGPPVVADRPVGECCPGVPIPPDEHVVVNPDGTLRNVTVFIEGGPNVAGPPPATALLTQVGCRYVPHVLALRTGQKLVITSHDPVEHNVIVDAPNNKSDNFAEAAGESRAVTFDLPDEVKFNCQVHPYMGARATVFDHPCYAVTGDGGAFRIDRLPPGTYTLVARHERYGEMRKPFTVSAGTPTADVTFDYHP